MEKVVAKGKSVNISKILSIIGVFTLFYMLSKAYIGSPDTHTFAFGMLFAGIRFTQFGLLLSVLYFVAHMLACFSLEGLYVALGTLICSLLMVLIKNKGKAKPYVYYIFALLSQVVFVAINFSTPRIILLSIFATVLGMFFMIACNILLNAISTRKHNFSLNLDEIIALSLVLCVFGVGLSTINGIGINLLKIFTVFAILFTTYAFNTNVPLIVSCVLGVSGSLISQNPLTIAQFVCFALVSVAFKTNFKALSVVAIGIMQVMFDFYFSGYAAFSYISLIDIAIGGLIFVLIPQKFTENIKDVFGNAKDKIAVRNIVNRSKEGICKRMHEISQVFADMDRTYRNMIKGVLPVEDAKNMIAQELVGRVCSKCPERNKCMRVDGKFTTQVFEEILDAGFERGKATLLDVPPYLTSKCGHVNTLINNLNSLLKNYRNYTNMVNSMDSSRILIADQLAGVSSILKSLATEINLNVTFDVGLENRIVEELTYKNIICYEAIVYEQSVDSKNITLLLKDDTKNMDMVEKVVSKICNCKVRVVDTNVSQVPNLKLVTLKTAPNYDLVFGASTVGREGVMKNGDTHSLIKLDNYRYMVALCDGMGAGKKAHDTSKLSITLIENFYKAGFDNDIILNSVNKLLSINNDENYSTVDLCVLDLKKNICDFIKLGAPFGLIKKQTGVEVVDSSGLPIGVLEEMRPHITKKMLDPFDTIILCSDGVTDSFASVDELKNFVMSSQSINPQKLTEEILDRAIDLNHGVATDDMTVVACRIYPI